MHARTHAHTSLVDVGLNNSIVGAVSAERLLAASRMIIRSQDKTRKPDTDFHLCPHLKSRRLADSPTAEELLRTYHPTYSADTVTDHDR